MRKLYGTGDERKAGVYIERREVEEIKPAGGKSEKKWRT